MSKVRGLPADATITSIARLLGNPEEYVRQTFGHLHRIRREAKANARLRIGRTGTGDMPNYRIEILAEDATVVGDPQTFRGDNHQPLFEDNSDLDEPRWSTATSTYAEVQALLGEIRAIRKK